MGFNMNKKAETTEQQQDDEVAVIDGEEQQTEQTGEQGGETTEQTGEEGRQAGAAEEQTTEGDEVVVSIGEESPPQDETAHAPEWVRELRKKNREDQRRIRELEDQLKAKTEAETKPAALGKKPALEDYDYDTEKFEQALASWYDRKRQHDEAAAEAKRQEEAQQKAWQAKLENYGKLKSELKVKDFDDAEAVTQETLNVTQQGIIVQGAENPALLMYALGKNQKKAKELSSITDPVKFAFAVAKLETQLKVTNRKAPPPPEKTVQGTGGTSGAVDSTLERLRAEAEKSGDYTKVLQYKKQKAAAK